MAISNEKLDSSYNIHAEGFSSKRSICINLQFLFCMILCRLIITWGLDQRLLLANTPPRGWNSYDSFSWIITEDEFLANAQIMADKLKSSGYEYAVVDFLWYRKNAIGASTTSPGFDIVDEWGRPVPDPARWPSTAGGKGFAPIAGKVHAMGLKFGIHVMKGISTAALSKNTPVLGAKGRPKQKPDGSPWTAKDIALTSRPCSWMPQCFMSVNTSSEGGKAFINSLYQQYASWGVDFVKHDCVFGKDDFSLDEIMAVSQAIANTGRPIVYSISPGGRATTSMGNLVKSLTNMYRVTTDDWDTWSDVQLHFDVARDFAAAGLIGAQGSNGGQSWPDLDMLPLGWLTDPGANQGPHRSTRLTPDEQKTQISLWAMAKSPLIYGGDLRRIDKATLDLITNPTMLHINSNSFGNAQIAAESSSGNEALPVLNLIGCEEANKTRWAIQNVESIEGNDQLCWTVPQTVKTASQSDLTGYLNWTRNHKGRAGIQTQTLGRGIAHLWSPEFGKICLDSHDHRYQQTVAANSDTFSSKLFTFCSQNSSQTWELTSLGQLKGSSSSDVCAEVDPQTDTSRVWAAHDTSGQYYVALFNLGMRASKVSISLDKLILSQTISSGEIPSSVGAPTSRKCTGIEIWSNKSIVTFTEIVYAIVPSHGCILYSLTCSGNN